MQKINRDLLYKIFKKVKKLHIPKDLEVLDFGSLKYFSWLDESSQCLFMVYDYKGQSVGIKLNYIKSGSGPLSLELRNSCLSKISIFGIKL